jgi:hypothetical protein
MGMTSLRFKLYIMMPVLPSQVKFAANSANIAASSSASVAAAACRATTGKHALKKSQYLVTLKNISLVKIAYRELRSRSSRNSAHRSWPPANSTELGFALNAAHATSFL